LSKTWPTSAVFSMSSLAAPAKVILPIPSNWNCDGAAPERRCVLPHEASSRGPAGVAAHDHR
jgi:hypothetical protein